MNKALASLIFSFSPRMVLFQGFFSVFSMCLHAEIVTSLPMYFQGSRSHGNSLVFPIGGITIVMVQRGNHDCHGSEVIFVCD